MNQNRIKESNAFQPFPALYLVIMLLLLTGQILHCQDIENISKQDPLKIKGSLKAEAVFYDVNGRKANREPFSWVISGDPTLSVYGIDIPLNFMFTEQQRSFRQPLNRFGISPKYKWVQVYLGYNSLNYSKYTLAGHRFSGAGFELTPGNFRLGFVYGRFKKAVKEDQQNNNGGIFQSLSYKRTGYAMKVGYGNSNNYIDLILLKAKDDAGSLDSVPVGQNLTPGENAVLGLITHQKFAKYWSFDLEAAQSIYTPDTRVGGSPEDKNGWMKTFGFLMNEKANTYSSSAVDASLEYQRDLWGAKIQYNRIAPGYQSMGAYYFLADLRNITIEPNVKLWKKKVNVNASLGFQRDNLDDDKSAQTNRTIGSVNISALPVQNYQINAFYSNYSMGQKSGVAELDSLSEVRQTTHNAGLNQTYTITGESKVHNIILGLNYQKLNDKNEYTAKFTDYHSMVINANYIISFIPWVMNLMAGFNSSTFDIGDIKTAVWGPVLTLSKGFFRNTLNLSLTESLTQTRLKGDPFLMTNRLSFRASYKVKKHHQLSVRLSVHGNKGLDKGADTYTEILGKIGYAYKF
ncbi:MAG: hypothetical protein KKA81_01580 [Bacteroidetes bacterium]|nr:hypothetical protein [Bacteroidota bacterium]